LEDWLISVTVSIFVIGLIMTAFVVARDMGRVMVGLSKKRIAYCPICKKYYQDIDVHLCHLKKA
jgi:hypothetical protein